MIIYKVTNKINSKSYIGQTVRGLDQRKYQHIHTALKTSRTKLHFHSALKKYQPENFTWEILRECDSLEELNMYEADYIGLYNTYNCGYNCTYGGDGAPGSKHSEETKRVLSKLQRGHKMPEEFRLKISKPVIINGQYFDSLRAADRSLDISAATIKIRIENEVEGYRYA